jgi:Lycopene cyclase
MKYNYLLMVIVLIVFFLGGLVVCPRKQRFPMILSAFFSTPFSLASFAFVPEYWNPVRIFEFPIGPEDLMFSLTTGGIAWLLAICWIHQNIHIKLQSSTILKRGFLGVLYGSTIYTILWYVGVGVMSSVLISSIAVILLILYLRYDLWPIQLLGIACFTVFYIVFIKLGFTVFPEAIKQWKVSSLWGSSIWGIPLGEIAWAATFGGGWPLMMAYLFDARLAYGHSHQG